MNASVSPKKRLRLSPEPSESDGSAGQEVQEQEPLLVRLPEESSGDGSVKQEVQDVEVDPLPDAQCDDVPQVTMEKLPDKILQEIFALVPWLIFYKTSVWCPISWKKLYDQYLEGDDHASQVVEFILRRYRLTKEHRQCMLGFIRCVAAVRTCHCENPTAVLACLKRHSLFLKAEVCITRKLPDLDGRKEKPAYVRAVMAAIVLIAGDVWDIQELVGCLQSPSSTMSLMDSLEMLYSAATLLYAMRKNKVQISNRLHYSVFYCLHHLQNEPELSSSERDDRPVLQPTREQQLILNHELNPGEVVKIEGFAGTGKTSTLLQYAKKWSKLKFLYLAFNSSVVNEASEMNKPAKVTCQTFHSLACEKVGTNYQYKFIPDLLIDEVKDVLSNLPVSPRTVINTLEAFFASADESITVVHTGFGEVVKESEKQIIVEAAEKIWTKMKTGALRMTYDSCLKLYQLQKPSLSDYGAILVDEAQDCTPAMMDIVLSQKCGVILVGDPHLEIYSFKGAVNSLLNVTHSHIFYLTQSYQFGYEIAYVAATLLDVSRKVRNKTLVGNNQDSDVSVEGKVAWLSRTNRNVFDNAVSVTGGHSPAKIHFLGGIIAVGLDAIDDLWKVWDRHPDLERVINSPLIKEYVKKGFTTIDDYVAIEDKQLEIKIGIVKKYQDRIPGLVNRIRQRHVSDPKNADYILGTVHKAKGMEFDTVKVGGDFKSLSTLKALPEAILEDERNLLYVAVTRAKKRLILPSSFARILNLAEEYCIRFELATALARPVCVRCRNAIPAASVLILKRMKYVYMDGSETPEGFLCPSCTSYIGPIAQLTGSDRMEQFTASPPEGIEVLLEYF